MIGLGKPQSDSVDVFQYIHGPNERSLVFFVDLENGYGSIVQLQLASGKGGLLIT